MSIATHALVNLTLAAMAMGVAPDAAGVVRISDLDAAFKKLAALKPAMKLWWDSGDQMEQALRAGDVGMGVVYSGRAYLAKDSGANVAIHWSGVHGPGIYSVVQDAPHKEAAWRYLDWVATHPEAQAAWATALNYSVPHPDAFKHMPEERAKRLADYPPNRQGLGAMDFDWYVQNRDEISRRWQEFLQR